ncbi:hypothetical protein Y032_0005g2483 [Ancylostoma ceylanicum]|uniref:Ig-like domain-containing protein n=1 Tax=Ancylostoma ceylanicum TaxID=53326 RepID=A0A016VRG8_9BILA|nr:hypothetical protein Y032_0005g2483 [Ancylostoma ceylanicum]
MKGAKSARLDKRVLEIKHPSSSALYSLIKMRKISLYEVSSMYVESFEVRLTCSCVRGPSQRIPWFLNKVVSEPLKTLRCDGTMISSHST